MFKKIVDAFHSLIPPEATWNQNPDNLFVASKLRFTQGDFIAKDYKGQPVFLLKIQPDTRHLPPVFLEHLTIESGLHCCIHQTNELTIEGTFTVIRCINANVELQEYFLYTVLPIVLSLPAHRDAEDISKAVFLLVELFRAITLPSRKAIQGLWAELFVISKSTKPEVLIKAWHSNPEERFDFNAGFERIEVKSTASNKRVHNFTLEQLTPPRGTEVIIASIFVQPSGGGANIFDLIELLYSHISDLSVINRLSEVVALTLGNNYQQTLNTRYDIETAEESIAFFYAREVPSISMAPQGVSEVRFKSDLSTVSPIDLKSQPNLGVLFKSLI